MKTPVLFAALLFVAPLHAADAAAAVTEAAVSPTAQALPSPESSVFKRSLVTGLDVAQSHFDNWRAGGEDSLAWTGHLDASGAYDHDKNLWENGLKLAYGQSRLDGLDPRKSADSIHADSTYTRRLNAYVNPYASVVWDTQFVDGYQYFAGTTLTPRVVSKFMDPGYLTESLGLGFSQGDWFKFKVGAAVKQTFTDAYPSYADDPSTTTIERFRNEPGVSSLTQVNWVLGPGLRLSSSLDLFSNLVASDQVVAQWDSQFSAKVNNWLTANLTMGMRYDKRVSTQRQLSQGLTLGLSYSLF